MKNHLICSAATREDLTDMINKYFYSNNYEILESGRLFNKKSQKILDAYQCVEKRDRWRFERIDV